MKATCELCSRGQVLTLREQDQRIGEDGSFVCDQCLADGKTAARRSSEWRQRGADPHPHRRMGCIATVLYTDGRVQSIHRDGKTIDALREIADSLPEGATIVCISTWRTVLGDLRDLPRLRHGPSKDVDPFAVERNLLGRIGRMDLLPPEADPLFSHQPSKRRVA
jgi:hypothetical protein